MMAHHVVTLGLILLCTRFRAYWIGLYVLGLHDAADIFLYASDAMHKWTKLARSKRGAVASEDEIQRVDTIKTVTFAVFMVVFFYTRLYLFAWRFVFGTCLSRALEHWTSPSLMLMWVGMIALSAMHLYWFYLTCVMLQRLLLLQGGDVEDVREKEQ